jgi:2-enoate reductase
MASDGQAVVDQLIDWIDSWPLDAEALGDDRKMTARLFPYGHIFSSITINHLEIKNRLIMGPMGNLSMADEAGRPSDRMIAYFEARARGGVGLITSGLVPASPGSDPSIVQPGGGIAHFPRINGGAGVFAGWRDLADSVHAHGARFFIQLTAGLGRVGSPECLPNRWRLPVSASWNPNYYIPRIPSRPLTDRECRKIVRDIGQAAIDARTCGIDGVYLHGHEGYLLEQMTNTAFNRRGFGRYADWQAFGLDAVKEIRDRCGPAYPIMYRIDLSLALKATYGGRMVTIPKLRRFRGERTVAQSLDYIRNLIAAGVDIFDVDLGCYENWWLPHPPGPMPPGVFLKVAKILRDFLIRDGIRSNAGLPVPVAAVGKLGYPDVAERALRDGDCDMVMLARPLLADPDWPRKVYAGQVRDIAPCIGDQEACLNEIVRGGHIQCAVNPRTGFEGRFPAVAPRTSTPKRIAVVGAGPAGITCACLAAERGHSVVLFEQQAAPGGWLRAGSVPAIKFDVANYLSHLVHRLETTARDHNLECRLSTEATPQRLAHEGFDVVVCCTGSSPVRPPIMAEPGTHSILATELLLAPSMADHATRIVIVGGGDVGCETAHMLAYQYGKNVTVIEASPYLMRASGTANRGYMIRCLERAGVTLLNCARLTGIKPGSVEVVRNISPTVPSPIAVWDPVLPENIRNPFARKLVVDEKTFTLTADLIVFATGLVPRDGLYRSCVETRIAPEIQRAGDAFRVGRIFDATKAAYAVGTSI